MHGPSWHMGVGEDLPRPDWAKASLAGEVVWESSLTARIAKLGEKLPQSFSSRAAKGQLPGCRDWVVRRSAAEGLGARYLSLNSPEKRPSPERRKLPRTYSRLPGKTPYRQPRNVKIGKTTEKLPVMYCSKRQAPQSNSLREAGLRKVQSAKYDVALDLVILSRAARCMGALSGRDLATFPASQGREIWYVDRLGPPETTCRGAVASHQ